MRTRPDEAVVGVDLRCLRAGLDGLAGVGVHAREIVGRLLQGSPQGDPPLRLVPFGGSRWRSGVAGALAAYGAEAVRRSWLPGRATEALWRAFGLPRLESLIGPVDLLHGPDYFLPPHRAPRRIFTVHDLAVLRHPRFASGSFRRYFESRLGSWRARGTSFIAVSEFTRREMVDLLGIPPSSIRVVHNGVGPEFRPAAGTDGGSERLASFLAGHALPPRFFLGVGSIQPRKNLLNLLTALRVLNERGRSETLVLCGNQEWLAGPVRVESEKLGPRVRFLTLARADLPLLYSAATALLYPSFYEGFGLPLLEAMACGTPVAASLAGAHPEVAGEAALYFQPEDPRAIAGCMERLAGDAELRLSLSAAGRDRAALFTWERAAQETREAYLAALGTRRQSLSKSCSGSGFP